MLTFFIHRPPDLGGIYLLMPKKAIINTDTNVHIETVGDVHA
ncbi:hypothetical protein DCCM_4332 [Desulfocucumis palustris]|uniref:Uncharacterized protein n=1 Tax=Desulfocucumis palustris TaxID=1898651 RepID=A0A2L2XFT0_9FIRM|nr:hypothetical protein DCCM_4332 [Desulfocucumis palustris]